MATLTMHTLSQCKTWPAYHAAYLSWMQKHKHPALRDSNYHADRLREELRFPPIPSPELPEIYDHRPP